MSEYVIDASNADKFHDWFANRGGVSVWENQDLSSGNVGQQTFTPALTDGKPTLSPHWCYGKSPKEVLIDPAKVSVEEVQKVGENKAKTKAYYWGMGLTEQSEAKANRELKRLEADYYTISHEWSGCVVNYWRIIGNRPLSQFVGESR